MKKDTNLPQFPRRHTPPSPEAIRALRERSGLSIPELAMLCSVSARSWHKWEEPNGPIMPAPVWKLANMVVSLMRFTK